jgi:DNA-binding HxlR family transcriptional regulator
MWRKYVEISWTESSSTPLWVRMEESGKMRYHDELVLDIIREIYNEEKESVTVNKIMLRGIRDSHHLSKVLRRLEHEKIIVRDSYGLGWIPAESSMTPKISIVSERKVKEAIKEFFRANVIFPNPTETEENYVKMFGDHGMKDFQRYLRLLAERGILQRTKSHRYFYEEIRSLTEVNEKTLLGFTKK